MKYPFVGIVDRVCRESIHLDIEAEDAGEAYHKAKAILQVYPLPHPPSGNHRVFVDSRSGDLVQILNLELRKEEVGA